VSTFEPRIFSTWIVRTPLRRILSSITPSARYSSGCNILSSPVVGSSLVKRQVVPVDCSISTMSRTAGRRSSICGKRKTRSEIESTTTLFGESLSIPSWTRSMRLTRPSCLLGYSSHFRRVNVSKLTFSLQLGEIHPQTHHLRGESGLRLVQADVNSLVPLPCNSVVKELGDRDGLARPGFAKDQDHLTFWEPSIKERVKTRYPGVDPTCENLVSGPLTRCRHVSRLSGSTFMDSVRRIPYFVVQLEIVLSFDWPRFRMRNEATRTITPI